MIPAREDGVGRICWLASAIAGGWLWETPEQREATAVTLGACYLTFAQRRNEMPPLDMAAADVLAELSQDISATLPARARRRICKKLGIPYNPAYYTDTTNCPF